MGDDIFSDPKKNQEGKEEDSNMDWKKSGFDKHERMTLKINTKEAEMYNANKERKNKPQVKARTPLDVPKGFKRIRKKIRDSYDDEDEDEGEYILVPVFMDKEISSLEKALTPQEKKQLEQMEKARPEDVNIRQTVERDMRLQQVEKALKKSGVEIDRKAVAKERTHVTEINAKGLVEEGLKKRKKTKEQSLQSNKEDKPTKPAKELPKIKNPEDKEIRKALIDDAEKEKQSVKKTIERQQQEKSEIDAVTKEKLNQQKVAEQEALTEEQHKEQPQKQEEKQPEKPQEQIKQPEPEQKTLQEENKEREKHETEEEDVRRLILEKSGRIAPETPPETESEKSKQLEKEINQNQRVLKEKGYSR